MRWRLIALVSLGVNILLAAAWWSSPRSPAPVHPMESVGQASGVQAPKTNLVVRRQIFSWREIESPDYPTYIANLRYIGCPEQTIRDIIIADVNSLYSRKRSTELITADQQWWRSEPDTNVVQVAMEKARDLEEERRSLLGRLLGTNWESGDMVRLPRPTRPGIELDGPVLGILPAETKEALQEVNVRSQERMQAYLETQLRAGKNPDPVELGKLRQQTRDDLARLLAPSQLEEYLLRYSQNANDLRSELGQLQFFDASPDEFRALFRATDTLNQKIQSLTGEDPNSLDARKALEDQRENVIKTTLGPKRYEEYRMLQDPLYRDAVAQAQQAGTPEAARAIYQINLAAAAEEDRIRADPTLTTDQQSVELKRLELDQLQANTLAKGEELPPEPPAPAPAPPRRTYVIHPGDTIAVVSLIYGVPVSVLRQANPNLNINRLKPGDSINVPPAIFPPAAAP